MEDDQTENFLETYNDGWYPTDFLRHYEPIECFSHSEMGETLLVKERQTGEYFAAKCYLENSLLSHATESDLLRKLHHQGIPVYVGEYHNENMLCVVRTFIKGMSLDEVARERQFTRQQSLNIVIQLCDILTYLHTQTPSIIHRDIKPQNIIMDDSGKITLIDFGISRAYDEAAQEDTLLLGTRHFAAPEQYGFSQTDRRSDIFSMGILLCWLCTGSVNIKRAVKEISNQWLVKVILKCTAFDPCDRYRSAAQLKNALNGCTRKRRWVVSVSAFLMVVLGFMYLIQPLQIWGTHMDKVSFQEPLIEEAVRFMLEKDNDEVILEEELSSIEELFVFGNKAAPDAETFHEYAIDFVDNGGSISRGSISVLDDLVQMKNLRNISLVYQNITDLSPLSELLFLEYVDLRHNPLEDETPLAQISSLKTLSLFGTNVYDLTTLHTCSELTVLDVGDTHITSLTALDGLDSLQILVMRKVLLRSLEYIEYLPMLEELYLSETPIHDLLPLLDLPYLQLVDVDESMRPFADALAGVAVFEIIFQH